MRVISIIFCLLILASVVSASGVFAGQIGVGENFLKKGDIVVGKVDANSIVTGDINCLDINASGGNSRIGSNAQYWQQELLDLGAFGFLPMWHAISDSPAGNIGILKGNSFFVMSEANDENPSFSLALPNLSTKTIEWNIVTDRIEIEDFYTPILFTGQVHLGVAGAEIPAFREVGGNIIVDSDMVMTSSEKLYFGTSLNNWLVSGSGFDIDFYSKTEKIFAIGNGPAGIHKGTRTYGTHVVDVDLNIVKQLKAGSSIIGNDKNYIQTNQDGLQLLIGGARVEHHIALSPTRYKAPAANFPALDFEGIMLTLDFDDGTEESAYVSGAVPFEWATDTNVDIHVEWLHDGVDAGKVMWCVEFISVAEGDLVDGTTHTICQLTAGGDAPAIDITTIFEDTNSMDYSFLNINDTVGIRFYRDADHSLDTLSEDARMLSVHFHLVQDRLGQPYLGGRG